MFTLPNYLIASLSGALSSIMVGISASVASIKTALATSWCIPVCIAAVGIAIIGIVYIVNQAKALMPSAEKVIAAVKSRTKTSTLKPENLFNYSVYVIARKYTVDVVYVGMTKNYRARMAKHTTGKKCRFPKDFYTMTPLATGLTKSKARALEQTIITAYTFDTLVNLINSISPKKWNNFEREFTQLLSLIDSWIDPE